MPELKNQQAPDPAVLIASPAEMIIQKFSHALGIEVSAL